MATMTTLPPHQSHLGTFPRLLFALNAICAWIGLAIGTTSSALALYDYPHTDPNLFGFNTSPIGRLIDTYDVVPPEVFRQSGMYQHFLKTWEIDRALAIVLDRQGDEKLGLLVVGKATGGAQRSGASPTVTAARVPPSSMAATPVIAPPAT